MERMIFMKSKILFIISFLIIAVVLNCNIPTEFVREEDVEKSEEEEHNTIIGRVLYYPEGESAEPIPVADARVIATTLDPLNIELDAKAFTTQGIGLSDENGYFVIDRNLTGDKLPGNRYKLIAGIINPKDNLSVFVDYRLVDSKIVFPEVVVTNNDTVNAEEVIVDGKNQNPVLKDAIVLMSLQTKHEIISPWRDDEEITVDTGDTIRFSWNNPNPDYFNAFAIVGDPVSEDSGAFVVYSYPDSIIDLILPGLKTRWRFK